MHISKSVGLGGVNDPADVLAVKRRLVELAQTDNHHDFGVSWLADTIHQRGRIE
jgi:hypothetical protein